MSRPEPDTDCDECWQAEATRVQKARAAMRRPNPFAGYADLTMAMLGVRPPAPYERHRERYAQTGDEAELRRMLRHVRLGEVTR